MGLEDGQKQREWSGFSHAVCLLTNVVKDRGKWRIHAELKPACPADFVRVSVCVRKKS